MQKILYMIACCLFCFSAHAGDKEVLAQAYRTVAKHYIGEVQLSTIAAAGLRALNEIDSNTRISLGKRSVSIYYKGRLQKTITRPFGEQDAQEWADFTIEVLDMAKKMSPVLQRQDFELAETILYHGLPALDKNSRYIPSLDLGQESELPQAYLATMQENDILYIRPGTINEHMMSNFNRTMEEHQNLKGIIIDLRGNKGGYLKYALQLTDLFVSDGTMIYTLGREKGKRKIYDAHEGKLYADVPMAILVDGETASAAEVIAMVLHKRGRATLIGAQTYGKGTVQNLYKQTNGARIALTTEQYYGADDFSPDEQGIRPDICLPNGENIDNYLESSEPCPKTIGHEDDIMVAKRLLIKQSKHSDTAASE